jgi:hypothetical protein
MIPRPTSASSIICQFFRLPGGLQPPTRDADRKNHTQLWTALQQMIHCVREYRGASI